MIRLSEKELESFLKHYKSRGGKDVNLKKLDDGKFKKTSKYHNRKVYEYENGVVSSDKDEKRYGKIINVFDSTKEYNRWIELTLLYRAGVIQDLSRQTKVPIQEDFTKKNGVKVKGIYYKADFIYTEGDQKVIEDVKPFDIWSQKYLTTKDFRLKWKLMQSKYSDITFRLY